MTLRCLLLQVYLLLTYRYLVRHRPMRETRDTRLSRRLSQVEAYIYSPTALEVVLVDLAY